MCQHAAPQLAVSMHVAAKLIFAPKLIHTDTKGSSVLFFPKSKSDPVTSWLKHRLQIPRGLSVKLKLPPPPPRRAPEMPLLLPLPPPSLFPGPFSSPAFLPDARNVPTVSSLSTCCSFSLKGLASLPFGVTPPNVRLSGTCRKPSQIHPPGPWGLRAPAPRGSLHPPPRLRLRPPSSPAGRGQHRPLGFPDSPLPFGKFCDFRPRISPVVVT